MSINFVYLTLPNLDNLDAVWNSHKVGEPITVRHLLLVGNHNNSKQ